MNQNSQNIVLINNLRTACPTQILMIFLSSLDKLVQDHFFQNGVDNFEIEHKTCLFF